MAKELEKLRKELEAEILRNVELRNRAKTLSKDLDFRKSLYEKVSIRMKRRRVSVVP